MSKIAIVYWSGTGNTEKMASIIENSAKAENVEVTVYTCDKFSKDLVGNYDSIAFGCPSMGDEVLEETEFQDMWDSVENSLSSKKIALFGSYDWGDGEWMRNWESRCKELGANLVCDALICHLEPDSDAETKLSDLGKALTK